MAGIESTEQAQLIAALMQLSQQQRQEWLEFSLSIHASRTAPMRDRSQRVALLGSGAASFSNDP